MANAVIESHPLWNDPTVERRLGVHDGWCAKDRLRAQPRIPYCRIGRSIRYRPEDVERFITSNMAATAA
jgi:hypothetical protein